MTDVANSNPNPNPETQTVQPSPVPTTFQVGAGTDQSTGRQFVMLIIATPTGQSVYFLDSAVANTVGELLIKTAVAAAGPGLIVPQ